MPLIQLILEDLRTNRGQGKSQLVMAFFRLAQAARGGSIPAPARRASFPFGLLYRVVVEWVLGVELPWGTAVGRRLRIEHGTGLVVNAFSVIGDDVILRQNVTLGNNAKTYDCPRLGNGVDVGAGAVIMGGITLGDGAKVGANAVVLRDVAAGAIAVGVPAVEKS